MVPLDNGTLPAADKHDLDDGLQIMAYGLHPHLGQQLVSNPEAGGRSVFAIDEIAVRHRVALETISGPAGRLAFATYIPSSLLLS
jgi:hypothetical protein